MPETTPPTPPDEAARHRIRTDLSSTLFVEAGAGSGKTTALVERVEALIVTGAAELESIAAITFTEKAAAELRDRVRQSLERRAAQPGADPAHVERCRAALLQLDGAAIGTLHAFAQRLLVEHPVEAGLPPRLEVLDEVTSGIAFETRWGSFLDRLLEDASLERPLLLLIGAGADHKALRALAIEFDRNWDLVEERVPEKADPPPPVRELLDVGLAAVDDVLALRDLCRDPSDKLCIRLDEIEAEAELLRHGDDDLELLAILAGDGEVPMPSFSARGGKSGAWPMPPQEVRHRIKAAETALQEVRNAVGMAAARSIASAIRAFTLSAADERRAAGQLAFHDLLVLARSLLRDAEHGSAVRRRVHERYTHLLLDEFQDTDPIQIELAVCIAAEDPGAQPAGSAPWERVDVADGHLFVVGDPKQSIYRFRRADIETFMKAKARLGAGAGAVVDLTANFRTVAPVIGWVNSVFAALMGEPPDLDSPPARPTFVALDPTRPAPPVGPPVTVLGVEAHDASVRADDLREAEASDVVAAIGRAMSEKWAVGHGRDERGVDRFREPRLGDITVLVPARTSLPHLESALDSAGIGFRAEASSLVYATRAVRDLLMVLRAADDATDHLRVVTALRTPLLGCGDDDLFRHKEEHRGSWSFLASQPATVPADGPVRAGLAYLAELHHARQWATPSELLERIARERRAFELGFAEGRPRDAWRRLRFVIDQARAWSESTGGSVREYLGWVDRQASEGARVAEAVLPETDDDAVRVMTIHAAKGLEFPITIVSGMSTLPQRRQAPAEVHFPALGSVIYKLGGSVKSDDYEEFKPIDEQMAADERVRLLYVACTRARDHLVVSVHRRVRSKAPERSKRTNAELLVDGMGLDLLAALPVISAADDSGAPVAALEQALPAAPQPFDEWSAEREAALAAASTPTTVAATALTDDGVFDADGEPDETGAGLLKRPRDLDLPPWLKGRYGTAVGRAVHGVLQTIDLATGDGIESAVAAQCQAEAIVDRTGDVSRLVHHALGAPVVVEAAASDHWREVYACIPVDDDRLLEGYIDLLYRRSSGGLVVVDYKTAGTADPADLEQRVEGYRMQGEAYARAVAAATGEEVVRTVFVFLTPAGAVELDLPPRSGPAPAGTAEPAQLSLGL